MNDRPYDIPLVSIIINNFNYGRFLGAAIDSALAQSYTNTEILVVDDGSTDDSHAIIASYGAALTPLLKANGGQGSAFNAGFARCHGAIVIFLDADDQLHVETAARVVAAFRGSPAAVRVQWRLALVDAAGTAMGECKPPAAVSIPEGDLRLPTLRYGDDIPWLPTSGNAFAAAVLRQILPMPCAPYRLCADYYLSNLAPLYGPVVALDETLGDYRIHGANNYQSARLDLAKVIALVERTQETQRHVAQHAQRLALVQDAAAQVASQSLLFPANQLVCRRLVADGRAGDEVGVVGLMWRGLRAAWRRDDLAFALRLLYTAWFLLMSIAPRRVVPWLAAQLFYPDARGQWLDVLMPERWQSRGYGLEQ